LVQLVSDCADDTNANRELAASIRGFKAALSAGASATAEWIGGSHPARKLLAAPDGTLTAERTATIKRAIESVRRDAEILKTLAHPLVVRYCEHFPARGIDGLRFPLNLSGKQRLLLKNERPERVPQERRKTDVIGPTPTEQLQVGHFFFLRENIR
jgi:hypothetical protein